MKMPWTNKQGAAKVVAVRATVLLVSVGLCGLQYWVMSSTRVGDTGLRNVFIFAGMVECLVAFGSIAVGVIAILVWAFQEIFGRGEDE